MSLKDMRWENNFKLDIPKFHGGISTDSLLDWLVDVEEILEFQSVSEDQLVSLVVKKFRGQAASWWQQVKTTRKRAGKNPIKSWAKLKQKLCAHFLPRNYDHTMYYRLKNLKQGARFVDDFTDNCQFQDNDFVGESVRDRYEQLYQSEDKDGDFLDVYNEDDGLIGDGYDEHDDITCEDLIRDPMAYVADPKFDVIVAEDDDIRDFDGDDADRDAYDNQIQDVNNTSFVVPKFDGSVEDVKTIDFVSNICDPFYDGRDENFVEVTMKEGACKDFIESHGVDYIKFSSQEQAQVFNNLEEKDENTHIDKRNHGVSIYPGNCHRQIKREPPDRGQSNVSLLRGVKDPNNEIYVDLSFYIYCEEDTSFVVYEGHDKRVIVAKVIKITKPLVILHNCALPREDLHVSYKTTQKDEQIYVCFLKSVCMNWYLGNDNLILPSPCDVYANDVSAINHIDFFFTIGALDTIERSMVNLCVENNIFMMLLSRECMLGKSYSGYNNVGEEEQLSSVLRCYVECVTSFDKIVKAMAASQEKVLLSCHQSHARDNSLRSEELMVLRRIWNWFCDNSCQERINSQTRQLHLVLLNRHTVKSFFDDVLIFGAIQVVSHSKNHQLIDIFHRDNLFVDRRKNMIEIKWDAIMSSVVSCAGFSLEFLNAQHSTWFFPVFGRLVSPSPVFMTCVLVGNQNYIFLWPLWVQKLRVFLLHLFTPVLTLLYPSILFLCGAALWRNGDMRITPLGLSYKITTCFRWEDYVLNHTKIDIDELFEDDTKSKNGHILLLVGSFGVRLIIDGVSETLISLRQNFVAVTSAPAWVIIVFLFPDCSSVLIATTISSSVELHGEVFKQAGAVRIPVWAPNDISTIFLCWNNVACASRKLLTSGKLRIVLNCFSTWDHSLLCKEIKDAVNSVLLFFHKICSLNGLSSSILSERSPRLLIPFWYLLLKLHKISLDMKSACNAQTKITHKAFMNILSCLAQLRLTLTSTYKASHVRRRDLVFEPGDLLWIMFSKDWLLPRDEYRQASTSSTKLIPHGASGISHGDVWNLSLKDTIIPLHLTYATVGLKEKTYEAMSISMEKEDLLVIRVQGSLEATIVLTKDLYEEISNKLPISDSGSNLSDPERPDAAYLHIIDHQFIDFV
ncbi:Retrotransposon gag domain [Arabidopsis suecica]|uniref:Retrotransposon gag domain n=1 Tax=Arabidopsis suecica TaxID=45249 RepID=A0A8T2C0U1_ARASU|nr:Retrotransposon gag domain [Arabidopsis suecica]